MKLSPSCCSLVVIALVVAIAAKADAGAGADAERKLDSAWTKKPTPHPTFAPTPLPTSAPIKSDPTESPTEKPTSPPTNRPTPAPVVPTERPTHKPTNRGTPKPSPQPTTTFAPTDTLSPKCGTIFNAKGELLGPFEKPSDEMNRYAFRQCNDGVGDYFAKSYYAPSNAYGFRLTKKCEYQYRKPATDNQYVTLSGGLNAWFDAAAITIQRPDNVGYKVTDDVEFTGYDTPNWRTDLIESDGIEDCPEDYCVKVIGDAVGWTKDHNYNINKTEAPELVYAFSSQGAYNSFFAMMEHSMKSSFRNNIFLTNHFMKCGCESFCYDAPTPSPNPHKDDCGTESVQQTDYRGTIATTKSGKQCQRWDEQSPHRHSRVQENYPWAGLEENYCRNPDGESRAWCYTADRNSRWEFCDVPACDPAADEVPAQATCYAEKMCGRTVFKIAYNDGYPEELKPEWAETGTTQVMEWFSECAQARYDCTFADDLSWPFAMFKGTGGNRAFPRTYRYNTYKGYANVYGLGGSAIHGFPDSENLRIPRLMWTCTSKQHRAALEDFGWIIRETDFMRDAGLDSAVPELPCEPEIINPPLQPELPPLVGPPCEDIDHSGYCMQLPGGTCFIRDPLENCKGVDFVLQESESTLKVFSNVEEWLKECLEIGADCQLFEDGSVGDLTHVGYPSTYVGHNGVGWYLEIMNRNVYGKKTLEGNSWIYDCETWEGAYAAKNFTVGAGDRYKVFKNEFGDLFKIEDTECTPDPTASPSESPSTSFNPTAFPTMEPTVCGESYLDSESLNIALVVDLSFSTYEKEFSSTVDIGDYNGDGKSNTILDAQIVSIEHLLTSIAESATLDNTNCEIELISFETDAKSHGVWKPLNDAGLQSAGNAPNPDLMEYIKKELRAPTSSDDVYNTNNGYTNFDAALDRSVEYFKNEATSKRLNLLVFLSDGEPNVRGDGDNELYCANTTVFWNGDDTVLQCSDLGLAPGERHEICRGDDYTCVENEPYQDCVRGPNACMNADAATQYESEINALADLNVERLAIGVGDESNVAEGSALWMIDNNPAKDLGVLPIQALDLEELSSALKHLCILNTDPPTGTPSSSPSESPTVSPAPTTSPTDTPSKTPTDLPSHAPTGIPDFVMLTPDPTGTPSKPPVAPIGSPPPTSEPTSSHAPTFLLPDCYDGPKLVKKDSSDLVMCHYNEDMIQINDMNTDEVTIAINNVWAQDALPGEMRMFVHTNGVDSVSKGGEGFQCLDNDGSDIDIEGEKEFTVKCHQAGPEEPFLAVIDVVITDDHICGTNDVSHPCYPDGEPILESCSWRIVIPCGYDEMCRGEPELPTDAPYVEEAITFPPDLITLGDDDATPTFLPPLGPNDCPEDITLIGQKGVTEYIENTVKIISQDTTTVTVALNQLYTPSTSDIDYIFYQYHTNAFDTTCYEEDKVPGGDSVEITIQCRHISQTALLEIWVADEIEKGVLSEGDNAAIPECCHPDVPEETPVTKYFIEISCVTHCPEEYE